MLDNPRSSRVRTVAQLSRKEVRAETRRFLLEGPQAVSEALRFRPELLHDLFATPTALERHPELGEAAAAADLPVVFVTEQVLEAMADTVTPQGVVAVCEQFPTSVKDVFRPGAGEDAGLPGLVAILEQVRDPGNAGAIIRAADAAGAQAVVMTGRSVDPYNPKVVRSTTGSLFHVPVSVGVELASAVDRARAAGYTVLAADVSGDELPVVRSDGMLDGPTAWVFGNEARGLTAADLALVDRAVRVPIYGQAESMNLATAASVCLYESAFAHRS
ncbi:RNA methyltransferase [Curtobacterium sp. MCBD17_035]|uniref:TrmH family RNA methyltransferase n=1 Tax=Curtobacterium sp. MCBD17_035 TaxID=2175673 RepID=UPI000DA9BF2A|nr:RNA methyltransferase [Curtobacterium sp. MCBD17_035]WIB69129.1 RNA methyltransferase [Curtobacterium sp. MCBD17_035]